MHLTPFIASTLVILAFGLTHSPAVAGAVFIPGNNDSARCTSATVTSLAALNFTLCTSEMRYGIGETTAQTTLLTNTGHGPLTFALDLRREVSLRTDHHCFGFCAITEEDSVQSLAPGAKYSSTVSATASEVAPFVITVSVFACPTGTSCFVTPQAFTTLTLRIVVEGPP